jgi:hypothetical protein
MLAARHLDIMQPLGNRCIPKCLGQEKSEL